jgi:hypothetical protein
LAILGSTPYCLAHLSISLDTSRGRPGGFGFCFAFGFVFGFF